MTTIRDTGYRDELARLTPNLRRIARALVQDHNTESADDLVQATLVAALATDQDRRGTRLVIWLMATLVGLHRTHVREVSADKVSVRGGSAQAGTGRQWEMAHMPRRQEAALLGSMPLDCREVLFLITLEGFSYAQVAEALGLSLNAVIGRLARAREHLSQAQGRPAATPKSAATPGARPSQAVPYLRVIK